MVGDHDGGILDVLPKAMCLQEKSRRGELVERKALVEEGGAEGFALGSVFLHQGFEPGGEIGHAEAEVPGKLTVGDGLPTGSKRR